MAGRPRTKREYNSSLGKRLDYLVSMCSSGNISEFERKLNLAKGSVNKYFTGSNPNLNAIEKIVTGTGCNAEWFITGDGPAFGAGKISPAPAEIEGGVESAEERSNSAQMRILAAIFEIEDDLAALRRKWLRKGVQGEEKTRETLMILEETKAWLRRIYGITETPARGRDNSGPLT